MRKLYRYLFSAVPSSFNSNMQVELLDSNTKASQQMVNVKNHLGAHDGMVLDEHWGRLLPWDRAETLM